jgi:hypothetical protein
MALGFHWVKVGGMMSFKCQYRKPAVVRKVRVGHQGFKPLNTGFCTSDGQNTGIIIGIINIEIIVY